MAKAAPSILSANFLELGRDIQNMKGNGADYVHIDVMDGQFVPNISLGLPVVSAIRSGTDLCLDVHLMVAQPGRYAARFCRAGADILTVHVEADTQENILAALSQIRALGVRPAVSIKPGTPAEAVLPFLPHCSLVLVMMVEPGFGGQKFRYELLPKLQTVSDYIAAYNPSCELEVDGGINIKTADACRAHGATVLVSGSSYFHAADPAAYCRALRGDAPDGAAV